MWRVVLIVLLTSAAATNTITTTTGTATKIAAAAAARKLNATAHNTTTTVTVVLTTTATTTAAATPINLTAPTIQANTQNEKEVQVVKVLLSVGNLKHGSINVATTTAIKAAMTSMFARTMRAKPGNIDVAITNPFTTNTTAGRRLNTPFINIGVTIEAEKGQTFDTVMVPSGTAIATALDKVDNINNAKGNSALSLTAGPMSVVKWEAKATSGTVISGAALKSVKVAVNFPSENTDYFGMHFGHCGKGWIKTVKKGQGTEKFSGTIEDCVKLCFGDVCCSFISHDRFAEKCSLYKNKGCPMDNATTRYPTFVSYAISRESERSHLVVV